jgi:hypothetical protein
MLPDAAQIPSWPPGEGHDRAAVQAQVMRRSLDVAVRERLSRAPAAAGRENGVVAFVGEAELITASAAVIIDVAE